MRTINILTALLILISSFAQAQNTSTSSNQTRTIEINNDNGDLFISFENSVITKFIVNDKPIPEDRYSEYQEIIDDFSGEETQPTPPPAPAPPVGDEDRSAKLYSKITDYLTSNDMINPEKKFKIHLKRKYLKIGSAKQTGKIHDACLDFFEEIYGHGLNDKSEVKFKKSKRKSSSSINIVEE